MRTKPGKLVVFEGVSRSGKSTQAKLVSAALADLGYRVFRDAEPTDGPFGRVIRAAIENRMDAPHMETIGVAMTLFHGRPDVRETICAVLQAMRKGERVSVLEMQLIFMADRLWHCVGSLPGRLKTGENGIMDRYSASTLAFGSSHGAEFGELVHWHRAILGNNYITPALTVYVSIAPETALERMAKDGKVNDIFETEEGIKRTLAAYERVWEFGRETGYFGKIAVVDGNQPISKVTKAIVREVKRVL
jgi:dTMP kinase